MTDTNLSNVPSMISLDDDLAMHAVYDQLAHGLGARHFTFDTIEDTLDHIQIMQSPPQVFIIDRLLPDGDGLDFASFVRKQVPEMSDTIFVLISGVETTPSDPRLITGRIDECFTKPFKLTDLQSALNAHLAQETVTLGKPNDDYINAAFADDLLRLSIELLHASQTKNADPRRILHSIHGIAGMLEQDTLRSTAYRLMNASDDLTEVDFLPIILHIVQQCEETAQLLTDESKAYPFKVAL